MLYCSAVLYSTLLYCTLMYCTVLYCTVLYCTVLYCTVLYYTILYYSILHCRFYRPLVICCIIHGSISRIILLTLLFKHTTPLPDHPTSTFYSCFYSWFKDALRHPLISFCSRFMCYRAGTKWM